MADNPRRVLPPAETGPPEMEPSRHHRSGPFGVVDIGTTKIACLIGRVESDGTLRVLGSAGRKAAASTAATSPIWRPPRKPSAPASDRPRTWPISGCAPSP